MKTIEDPVARHDAKQCGIYLCSKLPDMATSYIQSGCMGSFSEHIQNLTHIVREQITKTELFETNTINNTNYVDFQTMIFIVTFSFCVSAFLGYYLRNSEKTHYRYWLIQQKEF